MQSLLSMTPEQRERYAQQFRARAGIGVPALAGGASMAAMGVPAAAAGLGGILGMIPNTMGDQESDPSYRQSIQDQARTGGEDQGYFGMPPTQPGAGPPQQTTMGAQSGGQGMGGLAQLLQSLMGR